MSAQVEPWMKDPLNWVTVTEYARRIRRPISTVRRWCYDGTFQAFSVPCWKSPEGRRLWWIHGIPKP